MLMLGERRVACNGQPSADGSTHWSTRKLGRPLKIHHNLVAKAWQRAGLQPHRFERYMQSDDPDFESKASDVIGVYVNPPAHAAVIAVDQKTGELWFVKIERDLTGTRHPHFRCRCGAQDSSVHPALQQGSEADPLGISQPGASNE